jgi:hypothetical protein
MPGKFDFDIAMAFAPQTGEGSYDGTLDAISATLNTADGLLVGDANSGIAGSGLNLTVGRKSEDKAEHDGSFTRPLSDWIEAEVRSMSVAFRFCGNRSTLSTPTDADYAPIRAIDAILNGAGLVGAAWASGDGWSYKFGSPNPFSGLVYYYGNRLELLDCKCSTLTIVYTGNGYAIATADVIVGSIKDPAAKGFATASLPTVTPGVQTSVSAPVVEGVAFTWQEAKSCQTIELAISQDIEEFPDSNAATGLYKEQQSRETKLALSMWPDTDDKVMELDQAYADVVGDLDAISWQVGSAAGDGQIAKAHSVSLPHPELDDTAPDRYGQKAGNEVNLFARHDTTANEELEIIFK